MKKVLFYALLLLSNILTSQNTECELFTLAQDLVKGGDNFKTIVNKDKGFFAYNFIRQAIPNTTGTTLFALDPTTLNKVADMISEGSAFRNKMSQLGMNWEDELANILKTAEKAPCGKCDPPSGYSKGIPNMEKHLENVEYFLNNFSKDGKAEKFFNWMRGKNSKAGELANEGNKMEMFMTLDELKKGNFTESNVEIGAKFKPNSQTSKMSDIRSGDLDIELKNKNFPDADSGGKLADADVEQVLGSEGAFSSKSNINQYHWKAMPLRDNANVTNLKKLWKKAFIAKADDMFKSVEEGGLGLQKMKQLFGTSQFNFNNSNQFKALLNNNEAFRNHVFQFIKAQ